MKPGIVIQDRYELRELLGRGGMAEVWLAHDGRLERPVAVKFLASHFGENPEYLVRFFSEAQSVARIQHPGVVTVLDFGAFEDHPFLVMYYIAGGSLADIIGTPQHVERSLPLIERVADAAGAAHRLGIVHRDIKPGNILIDEEGLPRLADFGIASTAGAEHLTATGTAVGSPHYVSPEQAKGVPTGPGSDVYALGVVLYELLTGRKPFEGNVTAIVIAHVEQVPPSPSTHAAGITPDVDDLVMRCLAKDANDRFADGAEMARAIRALGVEGSTGGMPVSDQTSPPAASTGGSGEVHTAPFDPRDPGSDARPTARRRVAAGVLAALLLVAIGLGLLFFGRAGSPDSARGTEGDPKPRIGVSSNNGGSGDSIEGDSSSPSGSGEAFPTGDGSDESGRSGEDNASDPADGEDDEVVDPDESPSPSASPSPDPSPVDSVEP